MGKNKILGNLTEEKRKYLREWERRNPEKVKKYQKDYYEKNKEEVIKRKSKYNKEVYTPKHKEKIKDYSKNYYKKNKERLDKSKIEWADKNKERISKQKKEYALKNKEQISIRHKKYYEENKEDILLRKKPYHKEYGKKRRKTDKVFKLLCNLRGRVRGALTTYTEKGKIAKAREYEIDYKAIIDHLKPLPNDIEKYEIHHIKPLFTFNLEVKEEIKKAFAPENHKLLLKSEHRKINHFRLNNG